MSSLAPAIADTPSSPVSLRTSLPVPSPISVRVIVSVRPALTLNAVTEAPTVRSRLLVVQLGTGRAATSAAPQAVPPRKRQTAAVTASRAGSATGTTATAATRAATAPSTPTYSSAPAPALPEGRRRRSQARAARGRGSGRGGTATGCPRAPARRRARGPRVRPKRPVPAGSPRAPGALGRGLYAAARAGVGGDTDATGCSRRPPGRPRARRRCWRCCWP